jgi:hypothetical protein
VMDQVRSQGSELLSHALAAARPIAVDVEQAVLQIGFPAGARFNKRKAEVPDARQRFAEAIKTIVGEQLRPVYVLLEGEEAPAGAPGESELSAEELIEKLKAEFDAEEFEADPVPDAASDAGAPGMDAGLDAGPGIDTGEAAA